MKKNMDTACHVAIKRAVAKSSLTKRAQARLLAGVGGYISGGADGMVFEWGPTRVIKFHLNTRGKDRFGQVRDVVEKVKRGRNVVRVVEMKRLGVHFYYMIMERLKPLSPLEGRQTEEEWLARKWDSPGVREMWSELRSFKVEKGLHYGDMHMGNVMKKGKTWKLIDMDGFLYTGANRLYDDLKLPMS